MRRSRLPTPEEVLTNRAAADLAALVTLIHQVNPTDRGLSRAETERRYALKSRLQSLLLRSWPEQLSVSVDPADDDIVSIDVRVGGRDAGHARISALDEDVRPRVRSMLASGEERAPQAPLAGDSREGRSEALAAVEEGNYALAAELWLAQGRTGSADAAAEGLAVLVDWLGDLEAAVAAFHALPAPIQADPRSRVILARGHAEARDLGSARELLQGCSGSEAAAVWEQLARRALEADDPSSCRQALERMLEADATRRQASVELGDRLRQREESLRAPLRRALDRALAVGAPAEIEAALSAIERAFPGDGHARAVRAERERSNTAQAAKKRISDARDALTLGQLDLAEDAMARLSPDERALVPSEIGELRGALRAARDQAAVERVRGLLARAPGADGIEAWLDLSEEQRARVGLLWPALGVAAQLGGRTRRPLRELAEAALAVIEAVALLSEQRFEEAEARLDGCRELVSLTREGRAALEQLASHARGQASEKAECALDAAMTAEDPDRALLLFEAIAASDLPSHRRAQLERAREGARAAVDERERHRQLEAHIASEEPWRARVFAASAPERERIEAAIRARLSFELLDPSEGLSSHPPDLPQPNDVGLQIRLVLPAAPDALGSDPRVAQADALGRQRHWRALLELLEPYIEEIDAPLALHARRLVAFASLLTMDARRTAALLERGQLAADLPGSERLAASMLQVLSDPGCREGSDRITRVFAGHLAALEAADRALAAGDPHTAWQALDPPALWRSDDLQAAGRRLAALVAMPRQPRLGALRACCAYDQAKGDVPCREPWTTARLGELRQRLS